jgi:hypothetical protein
MEGSYACPEEKGIIPRMVSSLGGAIQEEEEWEFQISVIVVEIYMEKIRYRCPRPIIKQSENINKSTLLGSSALLI